MGARNQEPNPGLPTCTQVLERSPAASGVCISSKPEWSREPGNKPSYFYMRHRCPKWQLTCWAKHSLCCHYLHNRNESPSLWSMTTCVLGEPLFSLKHSLVELSIKVISVHSSKPIWNSSIMLPSLAERDRYPKRLEVIYLDREIGPTFCHLNFLLPHFFFFSILQQKLKPLKYSLCYLDTM